MATKAKKKSGQTPKTKGDTNVAFAELAETIKRHHEAALASTRTALDHARQAGEALAKLKPLCKHGEWEDQLHKLGLHERTAQRYMRIAANWETVKQSEAETIVQALDTLAKPKGQSNVPIATAEETAAMMEQSKLHRPDLDPDPNHIDAAKGYRSTPENFVALLGRNVSPNGTIKRVEACDFYRFLSDEQRKQAVQYLREMIALLAATVARLEPKTVAPTAEAKPAKAAYPETLPNFRPRLPAVYSQPQG